MNKARQTNLDLFSFLYPFFPLATFRGGQKPHTLLRAAILEIRGCQHFQLRSRIGLEINLDRAWTP